MVLSDAAAIPLPSSLVMAARFEEESLVVAHLFFDRPAAATRFAREVAGRLESWGSHPIARLLDLPGLWRTLELETEGALVRARARLGRSELRRVLALVRWFLAAEEEPSAASGTAVDGGTGPQ
jgi:hypothetical protein